MGDKGVVSSTAGLALLLHQGIGDTIRVSLTPRPGETRTREVKIAQEVLQSLGLRSFAPQVTACPGCGRTTSSYFQVLSQEVEQFLVARMPAWKKEKPQAANLQVAVMGCVVNGPGEARDADLGIAAGNKRGHLFVKGQNVMVVPEDEMVDTLVEWAEFIHEHGADAALEKAKATKDAARKAAQEDRDRNLGERGEDANESEAVIAEIRRSEG